MLSISLRPVEFDDRIVKILLIIFKILQGIAPHYLTNLINVYQPLRQRRSSNKNLLAIPLVSHVNHGHRAFSFAAPTLWNFFGFH